MGLVGHGTWRQTQGFVSRSREGGVVKTCEMDKSIVDSDGVVAETKEFDRCLDAVIKAEVTAALEEQMEDENGGGNRLNRGDRRDVRGDARCLKNCIFPVVLASIGVDTLFQVSAHWIPRALRRDVEAVFLDAIRANYVSRDELKLILTIQQTKLDVLKLGPDTALEKDQCLERFLDFANDLCKDISSMGFWVDYCDPCSGLPMLSTGNTVFSEVQGLEKLRKFQTTSAGACRVAIHPEWGSKMYPASLVTNAPDEVLSEILSKVLGVKG
mmetsp:Transcript_8220/g.13285  ORF Transcript_8220/g.13285 Transcript_8220/m.13285 type:complete len:270 (-) Transcript_8220:1164-1973(-)